MIDVARTVFKYALSSLDAIQEQQGRCEYNVPYGQFVPRMEEGIWTDFRLLCRVPLQAHYDQQYL